jgi:hypothetical protein
VSKDYQIKEKNMKIAGNEVKEITRDTAQVGCTKVTRAEAEALLAEMNSVPIIRSFLIPGPEYSEHIAFVLASKGTGWLAASTKIDPQYYENGGFGDFHSASFCLTKEMAKELLTFLSKMLSTRVFKYIIEYRYADGLNDSWERSGNIGARGEFDTFEAAQAEVKKQQEFMGTRYEYRARAI